jgi:hypothetical protein
MEHNLAERIQLLGRESGDVARKEFLKIERELIDLTETLHSFRKNNPDLFGGVVYGDSWWIPFNQDLLK